MQAWNYMDYEHLSLTKRWNREVDLFLTAICWFTQQCAPALSIEWACIIRPVHSQIGSFHHRLRYFARLYKLPLCSRETRQSPPGHPDLLLALLGPSAPSHQRCRHQVQIPSDSYYSGRLSTSQLYRSSSENLAKVEWTHSLDWSRKLWHTTLQTSQRVKIQDDLWQLSLWHKTSCPRL
jgi:hypothetical protein